MMRRVARLCGIAAGLFAASALAFAETLPVGQDLEALGWRHFEFAGERANQFSGHEDGIIEVVSTDSISALYLPISVDLAETPCLAWSWRVDEAMPANDLRHRDTDDRPISIFVAFPFNAERASFWERLVRVFVELARGRDAPGRVISYSWGGIGRQGEIQPSPYLQSAGGIVLLRPGDASNAVWFDEQVNIAADYVRIFEDPADHPMHVALLADSDSTNSRAHVFVRDIRFTDDCPEPPD
jgi:hypothetical protein